MADDGKLEPAEVVVASAGALAFLASFLPWVNLDAGSVHISFSAWSDNIFPTFAWVGMFGAVLTALTVLPMLTTVRLPENVMGFSMRQFRFMLALVMLLLTASFLVQGEEHGVGFWFSFLAAIAAVVGERLVGTARPDTSEAHPAPPA